MSDEEQSMEIRCACEKVQIRVTGKPVYQCFCHCDSCKFCAGAPFMAIAGFKRDKVEIVAGEELIFDFVPEGSAIPRKKCSSCMTMVGDAVVKQGLMGISLALAYPRGSLQDFYKPKYHVMYSERLMDFKDGVEKWIKTRAGGKGEKYPEDMW